MSLIFRMFNPSSFLQSQDGPTPLNPNGEPFKYCATAPKSLFGASSAPLSKLILKANPPSSTKRPRETTATDAKIPKHARKVLAVKKLASASHPNEEVYFVSYIAHHQCSTNNLLIISLFCTKNILKKNMK